jgi:hypothetical protein
MQGATSDLAMHRDDRAPDPSWIKFLHRYMTAFLAENNKADLLKRLDQLRRIRPAADSYSNFDFRKLGFANRVLHVFNSPSLDVKFDSFL